MFVMAAVYRSPSSNETRQNNNKKQSNRNKREKKSKTKAQKQVSLRKRSPIGTLYTWCIKKTAGTLIGKQLNRFVSNSLMGRIVIGIALSIALGAILDFSFNFLPGPYGYAVCATLCAVAGGAAGGAGGVIVGVFWGWIAGKLMDVIVAQITHDPLVKITGVLASWVISTMLGWYAGRIVMRSFNGVSIKKPELNGVLIETGVSISYAFVAILIFEFASWISTADLRATWLAFTQWSVAEVNLYWIFIVSNWITTFLLITYWEIDFTNSGLIFLKSPEEQQRLEWKKREKEREAEEFLKSLPPEIYKKEVTMHDISELAQILDNDPKTAGEFIGRKWRGFAIPVLFFWAFVTIFITLYWTSVTGNWIIPTIAWIIYLIIIGVYSLPILL